MDEQLLNAAKLGDINKLLSILSESNTSINKNTDSYSILSPLNNLSISLVNSNNLNNKYVDSNQWSALHYACVNGFVSIAEILINNGWDMSARTKDNLTMLHIACNNNQFSIVSLLIRHGVDVEAIETEGWRPLHLTSCRGHLVIAELLIEAGAKLDACDKYGSTPLHIAADNGHLFLVKLLVKAGADINAKSYLGSTPLHWAAENDFDDIATFLLEHKADVNAITKAKATPLHWACDKGHVEVAKVLIKFGADIELKTRENQSPLQLCCARSQLELVEVLLSSGADSSNSFLPILASSPSPDNPESDALNALRVNEKSKFVLQLASTHVIASQKSELARNKERIAGLVKENYSLKEDSIRLKKEHEDLLRIVSKYRHFIKDDDLIEDSTLPIIPSSYTEGSGVSNILIKISDFANRLTSLQSEKENLIIDILNKKKSHDLNNNQSSLDNDPFLPIASSILAPFDLDLVASDVTYEDLDKYISTIKSNLHKIEADEGNVVKAGNDWKPLFKFLNIQLTKLDIDLNTINSFKFPDLHTPIDFHIIDPKIFSKEIVALFVTSLFPLVDLAFISDLRGLCQLTSEDQTNIKSWEADILLCSDPDLEVQLDAEDRGIKTLLLVLESLENKIEKSNVVNVYKNIISNKTKPISITNQIENLKSLLAKYISTFQVCKDKLCSKYNEMFSTISSENSNKDDIAIDLESQLKEAASLNCAILSCSNQDINMEDLFKQEINRVEKYYNLAISHAGLNRFRSADNDFKKLQLQEKLKAILDSIDTYKNLCIFPLILNTFDFAKLIANESFLLLNSRCNSVLIEIQSRFDSLIELFCHYVKELNEKYSLCIQERKESYEIAFNETCLLKSRIASGSRLRTLAAIESVRRLYSDLEAMEITCEAELKDCQKFIRNQQNLLELVIRVEKSIYYSPNPLTSVLELIKNIPPIEIKLNDNNQPLLETTQGDSSMSPIKIN